MILSGLRNIFEAGDARGGLRKIGGPRPADIAITDNDLHPLNGIEITSLIRYDSPFTEIPIILLLSRGPRNGSSMPHWAPRSTKSW